MSKFKRYPVDWRATGGKAAVTLAVLSGAGVFGFWVAAALLLDARFLGVGFVLLLLCVTAAGVAYFMTPEKEDLR